MAYDEDGNCVTGSLVSYALPTAAELPLFETARTETPSPLNPLGAKGIGESGAIGATPAVWNAVVDALSHLGVDHVEMPATPMRGWEAIRAAGAGARAAEGAAARGRSGRRSSAPSRPGAPTGWRGGPRRCGCGGRFGPLARAPARRRAPPRAVVPSALVVLQRGRAGCRARERRRASAGAGGRR